MNVPRIRGKIAQIEAPQEWNGKWCFEISFWSFDGETRLGDSIGPFGPFETRDLAAIEMKRAVRLAAESCEKSMGFKPSGKYLDMKNGGILRPWDDN